MANPNYQYQLDGFGDMQQNAAHHLAAQQSIGGVPGQYTNSWSNLSETFRSQSGTPAGAQTGAAAVLQMSQQHQGMHQGMGLVPNQGIQSQMGRPTPRMQATAINPPNNFHPQSSALMPQNYGSLPVNTNPSNMMPNPLMPMGRAGPNMMPGTNPDITRQLQNLHSGHTGTGALVPQRPPSISNPTPAPQQWTMMVTTFQQKLQFFRDQARAAMASGAIAQLHPIREELAKTANAVQGELQKIMKHLQGQGVPPERLAAILKPFEELSAQYQALFKSVDEQVRKHQPQQPNGANFMGMNMQNFQQPGNRMQATQPWEQQSNQAPNVTGHTIMSQPQNRAPNQPNFTTGMPLSGNAGGIPGVQSRPPMTVQMNPENKRKFNAIIAHVNIGPTLFIQGHQVDTSLLYQNSLLFDRSNPPTHLNKFRVIGAQLGLPSENGQTSAQIAAELENYTKRMVLAIESATRMQKNLSQPGVPPVSSNAVVNVQIIQRARQAHPHINFGDFAQDLLNNLQPQVLEERIRGIIAQHSGLLTSSTPRPPSTKPAQATPSDSVAHQQPSQTPQRPMSGMGFNVQEILKRHSDCRQAWQAELQKMQTQEERGLEERVDPPNHDTFPVWRQYLALAFNFVRQIIPSMGFYYYLSTNEDEMRQIIHASLRVAKQRALITPPPSPPVFILRLSELEEIVKFLRPRAEGYVTRMNSMVNLPPELIALTQPPEAELRTLCGLMPQRAPVPQPPNHSQPPNHPPPPYSQHPPQNPIGATAPTPVNMPAPTPPHLPGLGRRPGFSDPSTSSPNHPTPGVAPVVAPTPPSAASPPKPKAPARPRPPKKEKKVKAPNEPTPTEVASTPTPTASGSSLKRPHDEAETPAPQPEGPLVKKVKTEPAPPVAPAVPAAPPKPPSPIKPSTPPPQLSPPVDRSSIQSVEQATELLTETFKRAEEQEAISQTPGQNSTELFQWLSQLLSTSPIAAPPATSTPAPPTIEESNLVEIDIAADIEFFDWGNYYSEPESTTLPELDKHTTVSPESHNNDITTTTPPSQTATPAQGTSTATSSLTEKDAKAQTGSKASVMTVGLLPESEFTLSETGYLSPSGFPFDKAIDPWEDPWGAIA